MRQTKIPESTLRVRASLKNAPKIAEQVGQLSVAWAALEFRIFALFILFSGMSVPLARAIFYSQRTTRGRIEIVLAAAPIVLRRRRGKGTTADLKTLKKICGGINVLAGDRNKYIHDPWAGYSETGRRTFQFRLDGKEVHGEYVPVSTTEIARLV